VTSPADATYAEIRVRGSAATSSDPYFWGTRIFFAQALSGQTELSPWSDGPRTGAFSELSQITTSNVTTYIANAAIGNAQIENAAITTAKIGTGQITAATIADATITGAKIASATIASANIANAAITDAKIAALAVGTANIVDLNVTTAKIGNLAVTNIASVYTAEAISAGTSGTWTEIQSVSITTAGGNVIIQASGCVRIVAFSIRVRRGATVIATLPSTFKTGAGFFSFQIVDTPTAGTYAYEIDIDPSGSGGDVQGRALVLLERKK
jgi:hypothetical protein